ncbi:hypothetical protein BRAS3843_820006 [Bradyrhizobium sp. STM 3843]|nr:hypothetical protein BRAS3843_820006 [Bradyrhizobium sp. STM 3843]
MKETEAKAAQCRQLSSEYRVRAQQPGIPERRANLLRNISGSYSALATQFEMLALYIVQEKRILRCGSRAP